MPMLYSVGGAYVRMGAWSYLLHDKHYPRFFFVLSETVASRRQRRYRRNILFHLNLILWVKNHFLCWQWQACYCFRLVTVPKRVWVVTVKL